LSGLRFGEEDTVGLFNGHAGAAVASAAHVPTRLALGSTMIAHGAQKFRGGALEQTGRFFEKAGIRPGRKMAALAGAMEIGAGILAIAGIATRPAALAVLVTQTVAVAKVERKKGFSGGFEFNLALMAIAAGLLIAGPGRVSAHGAMHRRFERRRRWMRPRELPAWWEWLQ
jgi:putative oxidoreductase